jgi:hypothetical protein
MKKMLLLVAAVTLCLSLTPSKTPKTYDLQWAIENKLISCEFRGNDESPHYYQPLVVEIKNLTSKELNIKIPTGLKFKSKAEEYQDIIVTQEALIAVLKNGEAQLPLFGMCTEKYNSAPSAGELYLPDGMAVGNLNLLAAEIEQQKAFDYAGQNAIWNLTNDGILEDIAGYAFDAGAPLQSYVADLLNIPNNNNTPAVAAIQETLVKRNAGGNFRYKFSKTSAVTIGMFNDKDIIVRELYSNPETPPGEHRLSYEFDTLQYPDDVYYIRLIINGQIKINFEMKSRQS